MMLLFWLDAWSSSGGDAVVLAGRVEQLSRCCCCVGWTRGAAQEVMLLCWLDAWSSSGGVAVVLAGRVEQLSRCCCCVGWTRGAAQSQARE